jgi:hypothetical protein
MRPFSIGAMHEIDYDNHMETESLLNIAERDTANGSCEIFAFVQAMFPAIIFSPIKY